MYNPIMSDKNIFHNVQQLLFEFSLSTTLYISMFIELTIDHLLDLFFLLNFFYQSTLLNISRQ